MTVALVNDAAAYSGFRVLERQDLPHVINLQTACIDALGEGQTLVHKKSEDDFGSILTSPNSGMLGIWDQGVLVAQAVSLFPDIAEQADMMDIFERELAETSPTEVTTLAGVIVHPVHKGRGLMNNLVSQWKDTAQARGRTHTLAMITDNNVPSLAGFLHGGLDMVGVRHDPSDDSNVYLAHGRVNVPCRDSFCEAGSEGSKMITSAFPRENREIFFERGFRGQRIIKSPHCGEGVVALEMVKDF